MSAGAIGSAQILLLSGIGPRKELEKHQIPVIVDLPGVGKNLEDHLMTPLFYLTDTPTLSIRDLTSENLQRWTEEGRGILTSCVVESQAWYDFNFNKRQVPDIQMAFCPITIDEDLMLNFNYKSEMYEQYFKSKTGDGKQHTVACVAILLHPKSKGEILLQSCDPFAHPIINPNYLQEQEDVQVLIEACKLWDKICQTKPLDSAIRSTAKEIDGNGTYKNEDQFWESYNRKFGVTCYHPTGTCKMGKEDDPTTVVTPDTKVKGVKGLRVIDASIMPTIVSGNTNIPTIAIAERAADLIKNNV